MDLTIAVISDLHCHPMGQTPWSSLLHSDALASPVKQHPIYSLLDLIKNEHLSVDVVAVPGDLTDKCNQQGIISAWQYVGNVFQALNANVLVSTIGNHDVDSRSETKNPFHLAHEFHPEYPIPDEVARKDFWAKRFCLIEHEDSRILVINSAGQHTNSTNAQRGEITLADLENIQKEISGLSRKKFQFAMVHHHPIQHEDLGLGSHDLMVGGQQLMEILEENHFQLLIHGHKHYPKLRYAPGGQNSVVVFGAASLSATSNWGLLTNTRNLFHIIRLNDLSLPGCNQLGTIHSWEFKHGRGWTKPTMASADFPSSTGFGCRLPLKMLVEKTEQWFRSTCQQVVDWPDCIQHVPELSFLTPADFKSFGKLLDKTHSIFLKPEPPDLPDIMGKLSRGSN